MSLSMKDESDVYFLLDGAEATSSTTCALEYGDLGPHFSEKDGIPPS